MAILPIRIFPDPILRKRAHPIQKIDDAVVGLAQDMFETMANAQGIGLAANQVGVLKRLITLNVPGDAPRVVINPRITTRYGVREVEEGCLSAPGYTGLVKRSVRVNANYLDQNGGRIRLTAEELLAQAFEHEVDHLNGILYLDHLIAHEKLAKTGVSPDEPHWHDVGYDVYVVTDKPRASDDALVELLQATAKLGALNADAAVADAEYDLSYKGAASLGELKRAATDLKGVDKRGKRARD